LCKTQIRPANPKAPLKSIAIVVSSRSTWVCWQLDAIDPRSRSVEQRRPFLRFFACQEDLSHESPDAALPEAVGNGSEPYLIIGAIAGG
jgi:hypothetical protein